MALARAGGTIDAALFQRFHPEEYHRRLLADGVRGDGRIPQERRRARLQRGTFAAPRGSATVRFGQSMAIAGVRAEVTMSTPEQPAVGRIGVAVEMPALCGQGFRERSKAGGLSTWLTNSLTDVLNSSHVFNPLQLDIREGEICWVLHVDVMFLNFDGNPFDVCLLAALAALEDTTLPALMEEKPTDPGLVRLVEASGPRMVVAPADVDASALAFEATSIQFVSRPMPVTFSKLPGEQWVVDPCASEEGMGASVSLCLLGGRWLVYHLGGSAEMDQFLGELMPIARSCVPALVDLLDTCAQAGIAIEDLEGCNGDATMAVVEDTS